MTRLREKYSHSLYLVRFGHTTICSVLSDTKISSFFSETSSSCTREALVLATQQLNKYYNATALAQELASTTMFTALARIDGALLLANALALVILVVHDERRACASLRVFVLASFTVVHVTAHVRIEQINNK
jgi:hypothetical protein